MNLYQYIVLGTEHCLTCLNSSISSGSPKDKTSYRRPDSWRRRRWIHQSDWFCQPS